jgi:hypothetical protein
MRKFQLIATSLAAATLVACGGGGGSSSSAPASVEVSGVAVKGLIKKGLVQAFVVSGGVVSTTAIDSATTNDAGEYTLTKVPADALVKLQVSAVSGQTKVVDETTNADYTPTSDFKLTSVLQTVAGAANEAHITQATDMVVKRATALPGGFTAANTAFASGEIQTSLGFSPNQKPTFDSNGMPTSAAAVYLKSVQLVANDSQAATTLGCDSADKATQVACVTTAMASKAASGGTEFTKVTTAIAAKQATAKVGVDASVSRDVSSPKELIDPVTVKVPTDLPTTAIAQAKAFVLALKTSFKTLVSSDVNDTTFKSELTSISEDFKNTAVPANNHAIDAAEYMMNTAGLFKGFADGGAFDPAPTHSQGGITYTCNWYKDLDAWKASTKATVAADAKMLFCPLKEIAESTSFTTTNGGYPIRYFSGTYFFVTGNSTSQDIYSLSLRRVESNSCASSGGICWTAFRKTSLDDPFYLKSMPAVTNFPADLALANMPKATITLLEKTATTVKAKLEGEIATAVKGNPEYVPVASYPLSPTGFNNWIAADKFPSIFLGTKHGINLNISASKVGNDVSIAIDGRHSLFNGNTEVSSIVLDNVTLSGVKDGNDNTIPSSAKFGLTINSANASLSGTMNASAFKKSPEAGGDYNPTSMVFTTTIKLKTDNVFKGTITLADLNRETYDRTKPSSASNFGKATIEIAGDFLVPQKKPIALVIKLDASVYQKPIVSLTYSQDNSQMISIKAYGDDAVEANGYVDLGFGSDITVSKIKKSDTTFDVKKNGVKIATYNKSTGKLEYLDGTFEIY